MSTYDLKKVVLQLKSKPKGQSFALYTGKSQDQILITPRQAKNGDVQKIADVVGEEAERRCRGICLMQNDLLSFKTKSKWSTTLEQSIIKVLRREGLGKYVPPGFIVAANGEALDEEEAPSAPKAKGPVDTVRATEDKIERLSGGNPRLSKLAKELLAEIRALKAAGKMAEAAEKEAYLAKVTNALIRTPEVFAVAKVDPSNVQATTAVAATLPHPLGRNGAKDVSSEEDFYDAYGQFRPQFKGWVKLVEKGQGQLFTLQAEVDSARAQYADRLTKGQKALHDGMKREFPTKLKSVVSKEPRLNSLVLDSIDLPTVQNAANNRVDAARAKVRGAVKAVAAAALDIHILELKDTIDDLEAKRKSLQATIDRNVGLAEKFISTALEGPLAIKGMLLKEAQNAALKLASVALAGIFSQQEQAELDKVNRKLDAAKRELKQSDRNRLTTLLDKAKEDLEAETKTLYAAVDEAFLKRQDADNKFAEISTLGASGGVSTFKELKQYRQEMQELWRRYADAAAYYTVFLRSDPLAKAYKFANERIKVIKKAQGEYLKTGSKTDEDSLILMDMSEHHQRFAAWYYGELQKYKAVGNQLAKGEHTDIITEVLTEAKKAVNG